MQVWGHTGRRVVTVLRCHPEMSVTICSREIWAWIRCRPFPLVRLVSR
jgi:hypothetical protein